MKKLMAMVAVLLVGGCVEATDHADEFDVARRGGPPPATSAGGALGHAGTCGGFPLGGASGAAGSWADSTGGMTGSGGAVGAGAGGAAGGATGAGGAVATGAGGAVATGSGGATGAGGATNQGAGGSGIDPTLLGIACVSSRGCFGNQVCYGGKCENVGNGRLWTSVTCEQSYDCAYGQPGITRDVFTACTNSSAVCNADMLCACATN